MKFLRCRWNHVSFEICKIEGGKGMKRRKGGKDEEEGSPGERHLDLQLVMARRSCLLFVSEELWNLRITTENTPTHIHAKLLGQTNGSWSVLSPPTYRFRCDWNRCAEKGILKGGWEQSTRLVKCWGAGRAYVSMVWLYSFGWPSFDQYWVGNWLSYQKWLFRQKIGNQWGCLETRPKLIRKFRLFLYSTC